MTEADSTMPNATNSGSRRRGTIQSVDRSARILKALASGPRRLGVSQLADQLGLSRPTVHGLLQTLQAHGFVEQDRDSDKYQLGAGLLHLGNSYLDHNELRARSIVHAEQLAQSSGEAVRVGVLHGPSVVIVHHVFRPDAVFQVLEVGAQLPAHASALGKAMLAWADPSVIAELTAEPLARLTNRTLGAAGLRSELDDVREKGLARERDEAVLGEASVAAPIFDHGGHAVGAIGVAGDTQRVLPRGPARGLAPAVVEAARAISRELGAGRWPSARPTAAG
jgi:DNA-binding IclR family transcriptional regulator